MPCYNYFMKKLLGIVFIFFVMVNSASALEIVYPKKNQAKINAPSTFFIGSVNPQEKLKINDAEVKVSSIGAFAQMVPLNYGVNNFKIISDTAVLNFIIERPKPTTVKTKPPILIEYPMMNFYVKKDGTALRMTPVSSGINRLSHLPLGTKVLINAEKGDFYRVYLNENFSGWITKSDVEQLPCACSNVQLKDFKVKDDKDFCFYEIELSDKVPFVINEEDGLKIQLFNIDNCSEKTYNLNIPMQKLFGYECYYENNKFILKLRKTPKIKVDKPLENIKITVDAGHGGCELGAIGGCGDREKDINLAISKNLKSELESRGAKVVMTREDDIQTSLSDRVKLAHDEDSALLISIHANAIPDGKDPIKNRGTSVYYYHNQAKPLAENILNSMTTQLGTQNDKVRQGSLALVRPTSSVSVLIEVAYIINPDDYTLLLDKSFQMNCAKSIADGIEKYILGF